jgi:RimJ/RimL family protein N-acetyltransferase
MTEGTDIVLRPFGVEHATELARAIQESHSSVAVWLPWFHPGFSEQEAETLVQNYAQDFERGNSVNFGIFDASTGVLIGGAGLNQFNRMHHFCNMCYWVRDSRQRSGYAPKVIRALAHYGFDEMKLSRIEIVIAEGNEASLKAATKAGAVFECHARNRLVIGGKPIDASVCSLLPQDI